MKRSFVSCLAICGVLFIAEYSLEITVEPGGSLSQLVGVMNAQTEEEEEPEDPRPERKLQPITVEFFELNEKITKAIDEDEDIEKAREFLDRALERTRRWNERELAIFHRRYAMLGQLLEDYDLMLEHMVKLLDYGDYIKYFLQEQALWQVATIYATQYEDFETALDYIQQWLDLTNDWDEGSKNYAYIGGIYTNLENHYKTEEWMTRAIEKSEDEGNEVDPSWWVLLWQAYTQLSDENSDNPPERDKYLQKALDLSQFLVYKFVGNKDYWRMLSNVYAKMSTVSDDPAVQESANWLYALESVYHLGLMTEENDVRRVISGTQGRDLYDLAQALKNFENLNRFGQAYYMSSDREKAAEAYETAVSYKDDATVLHSLASLYQMMENFSKCITFAERALNATEGELKVPEQVLFLKGVCQFYNDDLDGSEETMEEIRTEISSDTDSERLERLRESAGQYIELIESERARIEWKEYVEDQWRLYNESKKSS